MDFKLGTGVKFNPRLIKNDVPTLPLLASLARSGIGPSFFMSLGLNFTCPTQLENPLHN